MKLYSKSLIIFFTILSYVFSYSGLHLLPYLYILIWILIWSLYSLKKAMFFYLAILLIDGDISKLGNIDNQSFVTIYTEYIFGKSLFVFWTTFNFIVLLLIYIKKHFFKVDVFLFPFILVFLISLLIGITNFTLNPQSFISDMGYLINFFVGFLIIWLFMREKDVEKFFSIFIAVLFTKIFIIGLDSYYMSLSSFFNVYVADTTVYLYPVLLIFFFLYLPNNLIIPLISISLIFFLMMITASRGRFITAALTLLYGSFVSKKIHYLLIVSLVALVVFIIISIWNQDIANYLMWKIQTFLPDDSNTIKMMSMSSMVRLIELKNIIQMHLDKIYTLFLGTGFGGYFTSIYFPYPFNLFDTSSYPDAWIIKDQFFKPHSSILFIVLKFGFCGFMFIYGTVIYLSFQTMRKVIKIKGRVNYNIYQKIIVSLASFLPFLFFINYTSKLQIFSGVFFGILLMFYRKK